jgi:hypothetical protein
MSHPDTRFDWSSAISDTSGGFRRDFVFNVGTDPLGFVMTAGNNATRCGANPADPGHAPVVHISLSGWYTFKHTFSGTPGGPLTVTMTVAPSGTTVPLGTWVRSDPTDIIGTTVGGNRYGWFVQNEFDGLAIDNSFRTGIAPTPGKVTGGGQIEDPIFSATGDLLSLPALVPSLADLNSQATFGFTVSCCPSNGNLQYDDHQMGVRIKSQSISGLFISDSCGTNTHATITGMASVIRSTGTTTEAFTVDVDDCGEPGTGDSFGIKTSTYANGPSPLTGGNIQIH